MISARTLSASPPPTPPEIIEGVLHQGGKMALGGGSKSFKTWNLLHLSICIARAASGWVFPRRKGESYTAILSFLQFAIEKRIGEICDAMHIEVPENFMLWNLRGHAADAATILPTSLPRGKAAWIRAHQSLTRCTSCLGARDENATRDMADLMNAVERVAVDTGAAVGVRKPLLERQSVRQGKHGPHLWLWSLRSRP